jgi:hypothetical protein
MTVNTAPRREKQAQIAPLVGKKCLIDCHIQGQGVQALWDSGSQVTIIDELWKEVHLPHTRLRDISEILDRAGVSFITVAYAQNGAESCVRDFSRQGCDL